MISRSLKSQKVPSPCNHQKWNLISLPMHNKETGTDRNVSLHEEWNLIGYDGDVNVSLTDTTVHNGSDSYNFGQAVAANKVDTYAKSLLSGKVELRRFLKITQP